MTMGTEILYVMGIFAAFILGVALGAIMQLQETDLWRGRAHDNATEYRRELERLRVSNRWRVDERERAFKALGVDDYPDGDLPEAIREAMRLTR